MPAVDLNKNKDSITKAHQEVSNPNSKTNWALFSYDGQTDVLKLISKGEGGLEEMTEDLSSGKIMYAYLKVTDPNSNLPKFVFINWQGEGVPEVRKGACASHVRDVQNLLRGAHVSINARTEDDIDEKTIKDKVAKASGANYGFHKEQSKPMPAPEPVGSVYQKTRPQIDIKPELKQNFWESSEREERQRLLLEKQKAAQDRAKLEKETKEREEKEAKAREQRESERLRKIRDIKSAEQSAADNSKANQPKYNPEDAARDEEERAKRSDQMRKQRAAEAKALVAGRSDAKSAFEQKPTSQFDQPAKEPPPTRKLKHAFGEDSNQAAAPPQRKQPIQLPKESPPSPSSRAAPSPAAAPPAPVRAVPRQPEPAVTADEELYEDAATVTRGSAQKEEEIYDDAAVVPQPAASGPHVRNLLAEGVPKRPPSDDEKEDEQNWEEPDEEYSDIAAVTTSYKTQPVAEPDEELYEDAGAVTAGSGSAAGQGVCARALYDYQAGEENEITFDPDETITDIEMIDEGWWIGTNPSGQRGMFPSNYVELI